MVKGAYQVVEIGGDGEGMGCAVVEEEEGGGDWADGGDGDRGGDGGGAL